MTPKDRMKDGRHRLSNYNLKLSQRIKKSKHVIKLYIPKIQKTSR